VLVDAHAHLDMPAFDGDRAAVIERAMEAGLALIVTVGTDLQSSREAVAIADRFPIVVAAVGAHPNELDSWSEDVLAELRDLAQHPKVVAIGEIGVDLHWQRTPLGLQLNAFRSQLELAADLGLPVVVHDREAHAEVAEELARMAKATRERARCAAGMIHAFSGDATMALAMVDLGFYVSIAGPVTYPRSDRLRAVCRQVPRSHLLVETDSPFLAPQPVRGKRNEPAFVAMTVQEIARVRSEDPDRLGQALTENALGLFRKREKG